MKEVERRLFSSYLEARGYDPRVVFSVLRLVEKRVDGLPPADVERALSEHREAFAHIAAEVSPVKPRKGKRFAASAWVDPSEERARRSKHVREAVADLLEVGRVVERAIE